MVPGLGELAPTNLSEAGGFNQAKSDPPDRLEPKSEKSFDSVMNHQLKKQPKPAREDRDDSDDTVRYRKPDEEESRYDARGDGDKAEAKPEKVDAMVKFMVSLEGELGIEPEEMVQAMRAVQADGEEMSPEQSMAKALAMVNVDRDDVGRAAELYAEYLVASEYGAGSLQTKGAVPVSDMNFQVMTKEQMRENELASNVKAMRSSFFDNSPAQQQASASESGMNLALNEQTGNFTNQQQSQESAKLPDLMNLNPEVDDEVAHSTYDRGSSQQSLDSMASMEDFMKKPEEASVEMSMMETAEPEVQQNMLNNMNSSSSLESTEGLELMSGDFGESEMSFSQSQAHADGESAEMSTEQGEAFSLPSLMTKTSTAKTESATSMTTQPEVQVDNAQDLVDQAQVLVRKGGGQMRLKLNPEGLGEVSLKVDVQNGNVNIQMVADHTEAKKALEKGVNDLKDTLAMHKMNVENIKVDVSSEISKHLDKQDQQDRQEAYEREYARDFMGKMRDGNQNSRDGFLETPAQQYYQQEREELNPITLDASSKARANSYNHKGRLNLVA